MKVRGRATTTSLEARARRAAKHKGLVAIKSRKWRNTVDNRGGFMLINPYRNTCVAGLRFDMNAEDVIEFCK
jgi:hypothetical protein